MLMAGIDDAGRGAVLGPLAVAGILVDEERYLKLLKLGVKDSKMLTPERRRKLDVEIRKVIIKHRVILIDPSKVDHFVSRKVETGGLNRLEAYTMAEVIEYLKPDVAYIDASDTSTERFKRYLTEKLSVEIDLVVEHKADQKYPLVSAASILAKVARDSVIDEIKKEYGEVGSGYMADPRTVRFLKKCLIEEGRCPDFVRRSWKPVRKLLESIRSRQIDEF